MKKSFRIFVALMAFLSLSAAKLFAQDPTPTVSTAGIYIRYCATRTFDVNLNIPTALLPYHRGGQEFKEAGDYTVIYSDSRGCDSIVNYHITTFVAPFSVAGDKQVIFSKGNLQYKATTKIWRFAEHQWEVCGDDNIKIASNNPYWIDLFAYSASGHVVQPYETSTFCSTYFVEDIANTEYDLAWHNKISNGGNQQHMWYMMPASEWSFLFYQRPNSSQLIGGAIVNGVNGLVLLPDNWDNSISFTPTLIAFTTNIIQKDKWEQMELKGAIFIPATGSRLGTKMENASYGRYWTGSSFSTTSSTCGKYPYRIKINGTELTVSDGYDAGIGYAIRAVQEIENP